MKKNHSYIINIIKVLGISQSDHKYFAHEIKDPVLHLLWKTENYIRDSFNNMIDI